ncbi:MAG: hypothetical protein AAFY11_07340 [Cyanobacteria bacterium J06641_5]
MLLVDGVKLLLLQRQRTITCGFKDFAVMASYRDRTIAEPSRLPLPAT